MSLQSRPSLDPANNDSLTGMLRVVLNKFLQGVDDMLPARVIAYDRDTNRAQVRPLINILTADNEQLERAYIASVPVLRLGAGDIVLRFDVAEGDLGWIKANDRDISIYKQSAGNSLPNTKRKHSFEDAIFIPDVFSGVTPTQSESAIQTKDGSSSISFLDSNKVIDVQSVTRASIPWPRMTEAQRDAIPSPEVGMVVWNLDTNGLSTYNGSVWS